jgi:hypothetical protein
MSVPNSNSTASLANWSATTESEQLWNIWNATNAGGGGGDSDVAVGVDGVTRVPLNVNAAGELKVNVEASIDADLADIENALATTNGILTTTAADTAIIKAEAIAIDGKLPALSNGRVPVEANLGPSTSLSYSAVIPLTSTTIIGPVNCSTFRVACVHFIALGTGTALTAQVSNDGTNWVNAQTQRTDSPGSFGQSAGSFVSLSAGTIQQVFLYGALFFRINGTSVSGTTTLVVNMSQTVLQTPSQAIQQGVSPFTVSPQTSTTTITSGFATFHSLSCAATTNATSVKASAAQIGFLSLTNNSASWAYFHLVNKASAPTVGTDAGVLNIGVAPNSTLDCSTSFCGIRMSLGLAYYVSTGPTSLDTGALPLANTFVVNMSYA